MVEKVLDLFLYTNNRVNWIKVSRGRRAPASSSSYSSILSPESSSGAMSDKRGRSAAPEDSSVSCKLNCSVQTIPVWIILRDGI